MTVQKHHIGSRCMCDQEGVKMLPKRHGKMFGPCVIISANKRGEVQLRVEETGEIVQTTGQFVHILVGKELRK